MFGGGGGLQNLAFVAPCSIQVERLAPKELGRLRQCIDARRDVHLSLVSSQRECPWPERVSYHTPPGIIPSRVASCNSVVGLRDGCDG